MTKDFDLERFVTAQETVYNDVRAELRRGQKRGHWMWFIFPQIRGLGRSPAARVYAIRSLEEAKAYLRHPVLGSRLMECTQLVVMTEGKNIEQIFGGIDAKKFRSCMTLFHQADPDDLLFGRALEKYFCGEPDEKTLNRVNGRTETAQLGALYQGLKRLLRP